MDGQRRDLTGREVVFLVAALQRSGARFWLDGGWGVDALLRRQTRTHDDLDVAVVSSDVGSVVEALAPLHFVVHHDDRPRRLVLLEHSDSQIDLHPLELDPVDGCGWQRGGGSHGVDSAYPAADRLADGGEIEGRSVPCISAPLQLAHHDYAETRDVDRADVAALCEAFGLSPPPAYRPSAAGGE